MRESKDELMADIESTLDQLVELSVAIKHAKASSHFNHEVDALEKTQESLLARLMHRESVLELEKRQKMLHSIRKEEMDKKVVDFARSQKRARVRKARDRSPG